jgi:AcrR family transcriptional regulator
MKRESTDKRRRQIKKAVLDTIRKEGLHNLSIKNLARRVGISEGAIFRHFKSKREIIKSIMEDVQTELMKDLRAICKSKQSAEERLFQFLHCHIKYFIKNKGISILLFSEAAHLNYREMKKSLRSIISEQESLITQIIKDGIKQSRWDKKVKIEDIAILYRSIPIAFNVEMLFNDQSIEVENFCKRMFSLFIGILNK